MRAGTWRAAVSFDAEGTARLVAAALDALGYAYTREQGARAFTEHVLAVGLPRAAATRRFAVTAPAAFDVDAYDTRPSPGALLPVLEVAPVTPANAEAVRALLAAVAARAPRPPWRFTFRQRLAVGLLAPEFRRSRRAWRDALAPPR